jgi:hypothetical protein
MVAMTDADFARKQELLRQAMRVDMPNRAPMCCCEGVETVSEIAPSRRSYGWLIWPALLVGLGAVGCIWGVARASEPPTRAWVIWNEATNKQHHDHRFTSPTACASDITLAKNMPDGLRLSCVRIDRRKEQ